MLYASGSAAGDVGVARTGSRITRAMRPSAARGETSGPPPKRQQASFATWPQTERGANGAGLAEDRRAGKRCDGAAVAMPAEQHAEVHAPGALVRVVA